MTTRIPADDSILLVHAYVDGELDPLNALEVERRLAADPRLAAERERIEALQSLIRERLPREAPPPGLTAKAEAVLGRKAAYERPTWRTLAASVVVAAALAGGATWFAQRPAPGEAVAEFAVASHMRALLSSQPTDVSSSDRHAVKPWFNGRIAAAPRVVDLTAEGFPLVGGRIDVIGRLAVPTLVYRHRQHLISLFALPPSSGTDAARHTIAGYNVMSWSADGVAYWAVSDLAGSDLTAFARAFRAAGPDG